MTDNLLTRIAAVVHQKLSPPCCDECHDWGPEPWEIEVADAVIEALGLQPPGLQPDGTYIDPTGTVWRHTGSEWTDDPNYRP